MTPNTDAWQPVATNPVTDDDISQLDRWWRRKHGDDNEWQVKPATVDLGTCAEQVRWGGYV